MCLISDIGPDTYAQRACSLLRKIRNTQEAKEKNNMLQLIITMSCW